MARMSWPPHGHSCMQWDPAPGPLVQVSLSARAVLGVPPQALRSDSLSSDLERLLLLPQNLPRPFQAVSHTVSLKWTLDRGLCLRPAL